MKENKYKMVWGDLNDLQTLQSRTSPLKLYFANIFQNEKGILQQSKVVKMSPAFMNIVS